MFTDFLRSRSIVKELLIKLKNMNFGMLKNMVENLVSSYKCPFCSATNIWESNIDIVWAAGNTVNIDMHCPSCNKHFMAKTEVIHMEVWDVGAEKMNQLKASLAALKWKMGWNIDIQADILNNTSDSIKEDEILWLRSEMQKKDFNASDLFSD